MPKLLVIFGATGQQGGSVLSHVLNDPVLSKLYTIRAITRDTSSPSAQALAAKNIEVVQADLESPSSLSSALKGAHTIFALTSPTFGPDAKAPEVTQGKALVDAAVQEKVHYFIFSTLPSITTLSGGKYTGVHGFDAKAEVEAYIRTLPIKSAFFAPGSFMQNFQNFMKPRPDGNGGFVLARHVSPQTKLPLIDTVGDAGKYVGTILADPEKYEGKVFCAATKLYSMEEIARIVGEAEGKKVEYKQVSVEVFKQYLPPWGDYLVQMMLYQQDFGYYGPQTEELVAWAVENARGKLHTFKEYLAEQPLDLE